MPYLEKSEIDALLASLNRHTAQMALFECSWYNCAGIERVMRFCTNEEYREFLRSCLEFERMLIRSGIILMKYWFSVSDDEQKARFQAKLKGPTKQWKLSPMDLASCTKWANRGL
jgi:polyphosphate kinase 2 (PPK2 family)